MNTHTNNDYEQVISRLILESPQVKITSVTSDMLLDDINVDSLEKLSIAMDLEEAYDIEISDDEVEQFESVADIVSYIKLAVKAREEAFETEATKPSEPLQENISFNKDDITDAIEVKKAKEMKEAKEAEEKAKQSNTA